MSSDRDRLADLIYTTPSSAWRRVTMPVAVEIADHLIAAGVAMPEPEVCGNEYEGRCSLPSGHNGRCR